MTARAAVLLVSIGACAPSATNRIEADAPKAERRAQPQPDAAVVAPPPLATLEAETLRFNLFRAYEAERKPIRSTHLQEDVASWVSYAILVHMPSLEDSRLFMHRQMLDVLFHPHDQAPGVIHVISCPNAPADRRIGRLEYQVDADTSRALADLVGEFAVLVLDAEGKVLLRSPEPVDRYQVHEVMGYRDRKPSPEDHPPRPPRRRR